MEKTLKISELIKGLAVISEGEDQEITGMSSDSREIQPGNCFIALKGMHQDGHHFILDALGKGACAVLVEGNTPYSHSLPIPVISVSNLSKEVGEIAARYYGRPSEKMAVIGVTGTNGKTSISQFIAKAMEMNATHCGVIGTLGYGFPGALIPSTHTTCSTLVLQKQLSELYQKGAKVVAMEVSSHALDQKRVEGVVFDTAVFTNLTRDHIDYHQTMENYAAAKRKLFLTPQLKQAVINIDDEFGLSLAKSLQSELPVYCYSLKKHVLKLPTALAKQVHPHSKGISAKIITPWGEGQLRSRLLGRFNISNLLAVLVTLQLQGVDFQQSLEFLSQLQTVAGRMQVFGGGKLPLVVVDYAHTPDALKQVLLALREHTHGTLWCIVGCGGDRDKGKRPLMGQIAERYSDQLLITDDNPRTEDPQSITSEIVSGLLCPWAVTVEHDRGAAIAHVINCAGAGDVVLIAGKGHETYQIIGAERIPFSDREHVQTQLRLKQKSVSGGR
jgi:UDP-N-acetylmuramoyl-L-alanyl-D-glutamate--2,6-diaminopimelate ligase